MLRIGRFGLAVLAGVALARPTVNAQQTATQAVQARTQADVSQSVRDGVVSSSMTSAEPLAPASPADADLGEQVLLQAAPRYQPFTAWSNWSVFWTSNAELLDGNRGSDTFLSGTVGGAFLPHLGNNLFADFSVEQSLFRYARNGSLDFNSLQLKAGLLQVVRPLGDLALFAHYRYDLLTARGFNAEIYSGHTLAFGARKVFPLGRAQVIYGAASADFTIGGEPSYALRNDFAVLAGYQLSLARNVKLDLFYRVSAQAYRYADRADFNQLIGGGLTFELTRWLSLQAVSTLGINRSTEETYRYFAANLGGGVGLSVNF